MHKRQSNRSMERASYTYTAANASWSQKHSQLKSILKKEVDIYNLTPI